MAEEPLEKMLRRALKSVQPPMGLEEKIMARVRSAPTQGTMILRRRGWLATAACLTAACLTAALVVTGLLAYRQRLAEKSKEQLILALQITSQTLDMALGAAFQEASEKITQISKEESK